MSNTERTLRNRIKRMCEARATKEAAGETVCDDYTFADQVMRYIDRLEEILEEERGEEVSLGCDLSTGELEEL